MFKVWVVFAAHTKSRAGKETVVGEDGTLRQVTERYCTKPLTEMFSMRSAVDKDQRKLIAYGLDILEDDGENNPPYYTRFGFSTKGAATKFLVDVQLMHHTIVGFFPRRHTQGLTVHLSNDEFLHFIA